MAIEKKRMQQRYGTYDQFQADKQNLLPNEFASVTSGDPNSVGGKALYFAFGPGDAKRLMTAEDAEAIISNATKEATEAAEQAKNEAKTAAQDAQEALEETQTLANTTQQQITTAGQNQIDAIEQAGADQIEDIQNASIDQAEKIAIKTSAEGNPISVTDSADWRFQDFQADGWTEQTVTEGNQLITFPYHSAASEYSGINISVNDDGSITANGTSTGGDNFYLNTNHKLLPGTYTLSKNLQGTSGAELYIYDGASVLARGNSTFSISEEKTVIIYINWGKEGININGTYYPMLNYGSEALPYEPPSGGYPSPRPEIRTNQLFNKDTITADSYLSDTDGILRPSDLQDNASDYIGIKELDTIYVKSDSSTRNWGAFYDSEKAYVSGFNGYNRALQVPENAEYVRLTVQDGDLATFMVNAGSSALPWEPYTVPAWPQPVKNAAGYGGFDGELQNGLYNSSTGVYGTNNSYVCNRNPIFCRAEEKITVNLKITGEIVIVFYNSNGDYISSNSNSSVSTFSATVPENTAYCNFSARKVPIATITPFDIGEIEVLINDGYPVEVDVRGANLFDASQLATKTQSGATVTNNEDGSFTISGSGNLTGTFSINYSMKKEDIKNIHTGAAKINVETLTEPYFICGIYTADGGVVKNASNYSSTQREFQITEGDIEKLKDGTYRMSFYFFGISGHTIKPGTIRPMAYQDGDGTWEPYKSQTVRLISPRPLTKWDKLEKRDGKWGWNFGGKVLEFDGTEIDWRSYNNRGFSMNISDMLKGDRGDGYCNYVNNTKNASGYIWFGAKNSYLYIITENFNVGQTVTEWKSWLSEKKAEGKPMYIVYQLAEPGWVELSEEEQAAMKALETYYPTTVIQNSVNSQMRLQYIADPEHYLEQHYQNKIDTIDTLTERVAALETNTIKEV